LIEDYVDAEFSMVCEDDSPDELGELLTIMWRECTEGKFDLVNNALGRESEQARQGVIASSQGLEGGDAIDEDEDEDGGDYSEETMQQYEEAMEAAGPVVDEDGFETVARGKKGKSKR
jgi:hypothetical protein